jgi:adenine-specific DNA methylase
MKAHEDPAKREAIMKLYVEGETIARIANRTRVSTAVVGRVLEEFAVAPKPCGATVDDIEAGRGCGKCARCKAVEVRLERWTLTQRARHLLEA